MHFELVCRVRLLKRGFDLISVFCRLYFDSILFHRTQNLKRQLDSVVWLELNDLGLGRAQLFTALYLYNFQRTRPATTQSIVTIMKET